MKRNLIISKILFGLSAKDAGSVIEECMATIDDAPKCEKIGIIVVGCSPDKKLSRLILEELSHNHTIICCDGRLATTAQNINDLEKNMAKYEKEMPVFLFSLCDSDEVRFLSVSAEKNYFVPKVIGAEETKPKGSFRLRRDLFY